MTYDDAFEATPRERKIAWWLAGAIHVAFVVLLIVGVTWQQRQSEPAVAELWGNLPPVRQAAPPPLPAPQVEPQPEPKPVPKPPPEKPEPKPEAKTPEKPLPKPEVKPAPKPDIALKEKQEKERKLKEQKEEEKRKLAEAERRKEEEARKVKAAQEAQARKQAEEKKRIEKERLAREADDRRIAQEKQAIADRLAKEQAAAQRAAFEKYTALIRNHVRRQIIEPPNLQGNPEVEFEVVLIPGGEVLSVKLRRSSGVPAYDAAVERAILKASPLPLPPDPGLFSQFRELNLRIRPRE